MLLCRSAINLARFVNRHRRPTCLFVSILRNSQVHLGSPLVRRPPPAGARPATTGITTGTFSDLGDIVNMVDPSEESNEAPPSKRQRTDGAPIAAKGHGTKMKQVVKSNPSQTQAGMVANGPGNGKKRSANKKDPRIPHIQQAVKRNNLKYGMDIFREAVADGLAVPTHIINSLMYLAAGAEQWERYVRGQPPLTGAEAEAEAAVAGSESAAGGAEGQAAEGEEQQQQQQKGKRAVVPPVPAAEGPPPTREELVGCLDELWSYMGEAGLVPDQATYLGLARREALAGSAEGALKWAKECRAKGKPLQLRLFHPAQVCYCLSGDVKALHAVDELIISTGLDPTEYEYARLLEGIAAAGTYQQMRAVLLRMQADLNQLHPSTAALIQSFFTSTPAASQAFTLAPDQGGDPIISAAIASPAAAATTVEVAVSPAATAATSPATASSTTVSPTTASATEAGAAAAALGLGDGREVAASAGGEVKAAGAGAGWRWRVQPEVHVGPSGYSGAAGGALKVVDLADAEWDTFATAIADLARYNMGSRAHDFNAFVEWYDRNGPYDILVDAANVAFYGQNRDGGGFNWGQVQDMVSMLQKRFTGKKVLVMVHRKRLNDPEARIPAVQSFLESLRRTKSFYYTPPGANDDWFWLYACVRSKQGGLLISNDELRDHIFSLLRPKHFLKWKEHHIAHYAFHPAIAASGNYTPVCATAAAATAAAATARAGSDASPPNGNTSNTASGSPDEQQGREGHKLPAHLFILTLPRPYTACVQQLTESGAWMLPISDGSWMGLRPEREGTA